MQSQQQLQIKPSEFLKAAAQSLDIPDHLYEDAVLRYEDVGDWLATEKSPLAAYRPEIYPQGSFRLGTVIRPITEADEYDIDLVCKLELRKENTTQSGLKKMIGDRLKQRADLEAVLEESRRCWNLSFNGHFHMDVLPSIPNQERLPNGILLTDKDLKLWQKSNPITYADWFHERMKVPFDLRRKELAEVLKAEIAEVPEWQVKTPLQRAVQLLKRHRDIYFQKDGDNRPVSIIITTLAARAYGNQLDLYDALIGILGGMSSFIQRENSRYRVMNPVEPDENFADKWNEKPELASAFFKWLDAAQKAYLSVAAARNPDQLFEGLSPAIGKMPLEKAAESLGMRVRKSVSVPVQLMAVPSLGAFGHMMKPLWPEQVAGKVWVHGGVYMSNRRGKKLWDLTERPVPKNVSLKFTARTNVKAPCEIKWQVVNTGKEAVDKGDLRGDFYDSTGDYRWEDTRYAGTHWVEAFVIKNGICVARSGRVLVRVRG